MLLTYKVTRSTFPDIGNPHKDPMRNSGYCPMAGLGGTAGGGFHGLFGCQLQVGGTVTGIGISYL